MSGRATATKLEESALRALKHMREQLEHGFTGKFTVECKGGGIRRFHEERVLQSPDLDAATVTDLP